MIAKISATENLGGALGYNFKKVEKGEANILLAAELYQSKEGRYTMEDVLADMEALIPKNCRTKKMVFHCSLNPHPDEKLSDETLTKIAKEYMKALGYGKQPYIVFRHNDIAREHIHIVSLRIDGEGKKINDKFEKRRSKKITDALEKRFGLIPSSKVADKAVEETPKIDTTQGNIKEQVTSVIRMVLKHYRFCSLGELNAILSAYNLAVEEVKTEFRGKKYDGLVYVPTDDKGGQGKHTHPCLGHWPWCGLYCHTEQDTEVETNRQTTDTNHKEQGITNNAYLSKDRGRTSAKTGGTRLACSNPKERKWTYLWHYLY